MNSTLRIIFVSALVLCLQACCAAPKVPSAPLQPKTASLPGSSLVGSWQFVSGRYTEPNKPPVAYKSPELRAIKIITPTHFSYVTENGNGSFYVAGAGTCKLEKEQYTETLDYASVPTMKNKSYTFKYHIENDLWYMEGMEDGSLTEEIWQRLPE
jgi:predicted DNA-binding protein